ncbi:endonuclease [Alteromonas sp. 5E99-2]|uniref:endonuclease n=1 Tax=Alteromonas sp. 5E99-2 TaxID=2817683 RepID=UPI001A985E08|nr:endonuclease [Alteromonas sp. 5E99-2]MBO1255857.1 endonuclease [Alteromonas sp. 5E99-2]
MRKTLTLCSLFTALTTSYAVNANVVNGEFENWTSSTPDNWTTIDSGINLAESTSVVFSGNSSAAVTVNTGSQASTDLRQTISVVAGETYDFSAQVYHTEGGMRARLFVDGFRVYSDPSITGEWQQITYSYTASQTSSIAVGLRFYDVSGFDGSELVYVDDFEPNTGAGADTGGAGTCSSGSFDLLTDRYGNETSWTITNSQGAVLFSGSDYENFTSYSEDICLNEGDYTFTINDSFGDGICCSFGSGSYSLTVSGDIVASGGSFASTESTDFSVGGGNNNSGGTSNLSDYYTSAEGLTGYALKTALYNIINGHTTRSYGDLWTFYLSSERDVYYENDGSILDIYSESPNGSDSYTYAAGSDQCGNFSGEGSCYNREHSFPRSWFGGDVDPMNTDVHHVFATDGFVNSQRSSFPYGEVGSATFTSSNGSKLGSATSSLGYNGTVFEPIDEFKGDLARAYFYMATRYENDIDGWENNSTSADAVLDGSSDQVFEDWVLDMLKEWHAQDPVSQKELDRNDAGFSHQGNRNPFVDYPDFVTEIWGN